MFQPSASHLAIVDAFRAVDPAVTICPRPQQRPTYTHIHGPSQPVNSGGRCTTHWVCVERHNGTVALRRKLAKACDFTRRPDGVRIEDDPLGYSNRPSFGQFDYALTFSDIVHRWPDLEDFARDVIRWCRTHATW